jgi:hypothetical protein
LGVANLQIFFKDVMERILDKINVLFYLTSFVYLACLVSPVDENEFSYVLV